MQTLWRLAQLWYGDRLRPDWERPAASVLQQRLAAAGLTGPFWDLSRR